MLYDAVILAGSTPDEQDELLDYTCTDCKALIRIQGKEMVRYVAEALAGSERVGRLIIVGLASDLVPDLGVDVPVSFVPNQGSLLENILVGVEELGPVRRALFCSSDLPLLTSEAVRDFVDRCEASDVDVGYAVVERSVMERRFPGSGRSFRPLKDGHYAGGDLAWINPHVIVRNRDRIEALQGSRKSALRTARVMGLGIIVRLLLRRLTIEHAEKKARELFRCTCKAIISPFPEIGMDVDKVHQYRLVCSLMESGPA